jgi:hypothetical protein
VISREGLRAFRPYGVTVPAVALVGIAMGLLAWAVEYTSYDTWAGVVIGALVTAVNVPIVVRLARREADPRVARLLPWALVLKLLAAVVRLLVTFGIYDGVADANTYHTAGELLAVDYRHGIFSADLGRFIGLGFMKALTGMIYAVTGPTKVGAFFIFSCFGFWGLYFFYRAFCLACPEGDRWRYARFIFLLPSLLFWPSSIGKEAWMTLTLGLAAYGGARILARVHGGYVLLAMGVVGAIVVRPHVGAILMASLMGAYVLRRAPSGASLLWPIAKILGVVVLAAVLVVVVGQTKELFGVKDRFNSEAVAQVLEKARAQTSEGGSSFGTGTSSNFSLTRFPSALVSVLFRPFPWEAKNVLALLASVEGLIVLGLCIASWRRITGAVRSVLRTPYVVLCLCYSLLFVYGFSSFSNFGVLTRQRVQLFPFLVVLLALPPFYRREHGWRGLLELDAPPEPAAEEPAMV